MPQFNPEWFASQLFWLLLTFLVLYLLMSKVALPRVAEILQERQEKVSDDLAKAERMQAEAKEAYDAYEQRLHEARSQAQALLREANEAAAAEQARRQADFAKEMDARVVEAESRIAPRRWTRVSSRPNPGSARPARRPWTTLRAWPPRLPRRRP